MAYTDGSTLRDGSPAPKEYKAVITNANAKTPIINARNSAIFDELAMDPYEVTNAPKEVIESDTPEESEEDPK